MAKEFLHTLVREREERSGRSIFTVPSPRMYGSDAPRARVDRGLLYAPNNPEPSDVSPLPLHMEIPAWARIDRAYVGVDTAPASPYNGVFRVDAGNVQQVRERHFHRTYLLIGNVPDMHWHSRFAGVISMHSLALITQHNCYPDYNIRAIIGTGTNNDNYQAVTYRCAWCDDAFTLGV